MRTRRTPLVCECIHCSYIILAKKPFIRRVHQEPRPGYVLKLKRQGQIIDIAPTPYVEVA
jgi:hypothetical protein